MKHLKHIWALALTAVVMAACQSGNTYKIDGVAEGLEEGDTIFVLTIDNDTTGTMVVHDGKFSFEGVADSVTYNILMAPKTRTYTMFFTEPGTIHVLLSAFGPSEVSGTTANDALQELNQMYNDIQRKSESIMGQLYSSAEEVDAEQQAALYQQLMDMEAEFGKQIVELAKRHVGNEFGYMLITQMLVNEDLLTTDELTALIEQMPEAYRQRQAIVNILEANKELFSTNEGDIMANFTMQTPEGEDVSILDEVAKNRITVLDFWASWCQPCRNEMPFMKEMLGRWQDKGLGIVGISVDEDYEDWVTAIEELGLPWLQISDPLAWQSVAARSFKINGIPFTVVVDQKGTILAKNLRREELEQFISEQLTD